MRQGRGFSRGASSAANGCASPECEQTGRSPCELTRCAPIKSGVSPRACSALVASALLVAAVACQRPKGADFQRDAGAAAPMEMSDAGASNEPPPLGDVTNGEPTAPVREPEPELELALDGGLGAVGDASVDEAPADLAALARELPIVFRSNRNSDATADLYLMRPDGSGVRRITRDGDFYLPRWSPDGTRIVFRRVVQGLTPTAEVGIVSTDGSALSMLTSGEQINLFDRAAVWSLDGQSIVFGSVVPGEGLWLFRMAPSGGQRERLLPSVEAFQREVALAPDGQRLAYIETGNDALSTGLFMVDLARPEERVNISEGVYRPQQPSWSPDGRRVAFAGFVTGPDGLPVFDLELNIFPTLDIFVFDTVEGTVTLVVDAPSDDHEPTWSPDSSRLLVTSERDGDSDIWLVPLDDPGAAVDLIDDASEPFNDSGAHWYSGGAGAGP